LQSAERRRNMLSAQCSAAVNQRETVASGQTREKSGIEFPIVSRGFKSTKPRSTPRSTPTFHRRRRRKQATWIFVSLSSADDHRTETLLVNSMEKIMKIYQAQEPNQPNKPNPPNAPNKPNQPNQPKR
jgi:hypothetical protein